MFPLLKEKWKPGRAILGKAFSADHVLPLVPGMVDETSIYCDTLRLLAPKTTTFYSDLITLRSTIDGIRRTIL